MVLLKSLVLVIICLSFFVLSCNNSGSGSTTSSGSGTGTGWTVTVNRFTSPISLSKGESAMVVVKVKDQTGAPAPIKTRICLSVSFGSVWVDELGKDNPIRTGCVPTSNNVGQLMGTYVPTQTGWDNIQASSMGTIDSAPIEVVD